MNYEIIQINDHTWRLEEGDVRFFLLTGADRALLVDTGMMVKQAIEAARTLTDLPLELLNTHGDPDHIGCNDRFETCYMHPAEEENYRNACRMQFGDAERGAAIRPVAEGDVIDLGKRELEVIHLPGHTPGSIALLDRSARVLISGDPIQDGSIFMFGPARDLTLYRNSLQRLLDRWYEKQEFDEIWPSHGSFPVSPALQEQLLAASGQILAGEVPGIPGEMHGKKILIRDAGCARFLCEGT